MKKNSSENRLSIKEAAAYLGCSPQYLYQLRFNGRGPKATKATVLGLGRGTGCRLWYSRNDLKAWDIERRNKAAILARAKAAKDKITADRKEAKLAARARIRELAAKQKTELAAARAKVKRKAQPPPSLPSADSVTP